MTQKTPKAPDAPKTTQKLVQTPQEKFERNILEIQRTIANEKFGVESGKGGSTLKDSNALKIRANQLLSEKGIRYNVNAKEVYTEISEPNLFVFGYYEHVWKQDGIEVHRGTTYGGFSTVISGPTNLVHAVHGSVTSADTDILFDMLKANTKTEEELDEARARASNRQAERQPVKPIGGKPF